MKQSQSHVPPPGGRIMVADNEAKHRCLMTDRLSADGYTVQMASDGLEALQLVTAFKPDAILLDVMMPMLDGVETCRRLKSDPATASIPILLTAARRSRAARLTGIEAGATDFLVKPLDIDEVCLRVKNAIHTKRHYDQMCEAHAQLRKHQELRDNLTQFVVHDLRSPLTEVMINLELLKLGYLGPLNDRQKKGVGVAYCVSQQLLEMISSLLDVARMENDQMPLRLESCDVLQLVQESLVTLGPLLDNAHLNIDVPPALPRVVCDGRVIHRVLVNLFDNAAKYVSHGGMITVSARLATAGELVSRVPRRRAGDICTGDLETSSRSDDSTPVILVSVADTGPGIPREFHEKIFDKFAQVDAQSRKAKYSSGLGLTFCKLAVGAHGGRIGVESPSTLRTTSSLQHLPEESGATGPGSTFWFTLPLQKDGATAAASQPST